MTLAKCYLCKKEISGTPYKFYGGYVFDLACYKIVLKRLSTFMDIVLMPAYEFEEYVKDREEPEGGLSIFDDARILIEAQVDDIVEELSILDDARILVEARAQNEINLLKALLLEVVEELSIYDGVRTDYRSVYLVLRKAKQVLGDRFPSNIYIGEDEEFLIEDDQPEPEGD